MTQFISLDIDGTVSEYPQYWLSYLNSRLKSDFKTTAKARLEIGLELYEEVKTEWRHGPEYEIPTRDEIKVLSKIIYSEGFKIVMSTRRPIRRFPNMEKKISEWLTRNHIHHEAIQEKSRENFSKFQVTCHIDDEYSEIEKYMKSRYPKKLIWIRDPNTYGNSHVATDVKVIVAARQDLVQVFSNDILEKRNGL